MCSVSASQAYKDAARQGAASAAGGAAGRRVGCGSAAAAGGLSLRPRMSADEARKILGFGGGELKSEEILKRFTRLHQINAPSEGFVGSPYLQKRVAVAKTILLEECSKQKPAANAAAAAAPAAAAAAKGETKAKQH